jgi:AP-4 complex subunit epsilon-1
MNQVFELAGDLVPPKVAHDLMRLLAEGAGEDDEEADSLLRSSAVESYLHVLGEPKLPSVLLQVQSCDGFMHLGLCLGVKQNGCTDT